MPLLKKVPFLILLGCSVPLAGYGQALPTETGGTPYAGFSLPTVGGTLRYSLTASETIVTGYNGGSGTGTNEYTTLGGNLAYVSRSQFHPFSMVYSGGYLFGTNNFNSYPYQALALSQVYQTRNWNFVASDSVSYTPQTPATGLSGIPGAGDVGLASSYSNGLGILTVYSTRVDNVVSGTASRNITASDAVSASGSYALERYTGNSFGGINNNSYSATGSLRHRLDARTNVAGSYSFSDSSFSYPLLGQSQQGFQTHSVVGTFSRQLTHQVSLSLSAGPQWAVPGAGQAITQSSVSTTANGSLSYAGKQYNLALTYARGVSNGNGVVIGSRSDVVGLTATRRFDRIYQVSGQVGYNHSASLDHSSLANYSNSGEIAGVQLSAQVRQPLSVFASYTLQHQNFDGVSASGIAFNGLSNFISFGVTYSPRAIFDRK